MTKKTRFKNDISEAIHSAAAMLHKVGVLDRETMRDFDARHLAVLDETSVGRKSEAPSASRADKI